MAFATTIIKSVIRIP